MEKNNENILIKDEKDLEKLKKKIIDRKVVDLNEYKAYLAIKDMFSML